jgi:hypothetical protein
MKTKKTISAWLLSLFVVMSASAQDAAKYEIKSAIIQKEITTMGMKFDATWYIDAFGQKEAVAMTVKNNIAQGEDKNILVLTDSTFIVTADLNSKTGTRITIPSEKSVNYLHITPEAREKYKIKETGEEIVAGKKCRKYSLEVMQMGQTLQANVCVWKGVVLKSEMSGNGMIVAVETSTDIQENVPVPAEKFKTPDDIVFRDCPPNL